MKRSVDNEQSKINSIVLETMMGCCESFLLTRLPQHDVANLQLEAGKQPSMQIADELLHQVRKVMRKTWGRRAHSPCTLEILLATPSATTVALWDEVLLERFVLAYRAHAVTAQGVDTTSSASAQHPRGTVDKPKIYQRMCVLVRSIMCCVKALPALRVAAQLAELLPQGQGDPSAQRTPHLRFRIIVSRPSDPSKHAVHFSKSTPTRTVQLPDISTPFGVLEAGITYALDTSSRAADAVRQYRQQTAHPSMSSSVAVAKHPHGNMALQGRTSSARPLSTAIIADYAGTTGVNAPDSNAASAPAAPAAHTDAPMQQAVPPTLPEATLADLQLPAVPASSAPIPTATSSSAVSSPRTITAATFTPHFGGLAGPSLKAGGGPMSLPEELHLPRSAGTRSGLQGSMGPAWASPQQSSLVMDSMAPAGLHPSPLLGATASPALPPPAAGLQSTCGARNRDMSRTPETPGSQGSNEPPPMWSDGVVSTPLLSPSSMQGGGGAISPASVGGGGGGMASPVAPFAALGGGSAMSQQRAGGAASSKGGAAPMTAFGMMQHEQGGRGGGQGAAHSSKVPVLSKAHAEGQRVIALAGAAGADAAPRKPRGMVASTSRGQLLEIIDETQQGGGESPPGNTARSDPPQPAPKGGTHSPAMAPQAWMASPFAALAGARGGAAQPSRSAAKLGKALLLCDAVLSSMPPSMHVAPDVPPAHMYTVAKAKAVLQFS